MATEQTIRYSKDASIVMVDDGTGSLRVPSPSEISSLPIGKDLTENELEEIDQ
jgi:hypothetical protein